MFKLDDRRFNRLVLLAMAVGFALLLTAFVLAVLVLRSNQASTERVNHTYQVVEELATVELQVERAETASRGYLLVPDPARVATFRENVDLVMPSIDRVANLSADNLTQIPRIALLRLRASDELRVLETVMALGQAGRLDDARGVFGREVGRRRVNAIRDVTATMRGAEERLLAERSAAENETESLLNWVLFATGLLLLGVGGAAYILVRRYTADLTRTRDRLNLLNSDLEGAVRVRTADLQSANEEIQRFAYIVSHDLRSPLVNVMGFTAEMERADKTLRDFVDRVEAEHPALVNDDVRFAAREDLPEAIGFIRSSTQKMDRLINAILALSRQGRRVLTPEHLPMDRVIGDIADSLAIQAEARGATIRIESPLPDLHHDRLAVEQTFSNLMENATKYLQPGRPGTIVVRGRRHGARVRYEIEDNGRGIAANDLERVFELFRRSGAQDQVGEGIGLANVRALAYRLGGTVTVRSTFGEGSTFVVDMPATFSEEGKTK